MNIYKRLMNLIVIIMVITFFGLIFTDPFELNKFERALPFPLMFILLFLVSLINYLICGYFTIWHSLIGKENKEILKYLIKEQGFKISFYTGFIGDTFFQTTIWNIFRGFIYIASLVIIVGVLYLLGNLIEYFTGVNAFLKELFNYKSFEAMTLKDLMIIFNFNYYLDAVFFYIVGFFSRYADPESIYGWIDAYEKKLHLPFKDSFNNFKNSPYEFHWYDWDED